LKKQGVNVVKRAEADSGLPKVSKTDLTRFKDFDSCEIRVICLLAGKFAKVKDSSSIDILQRLKNVGFWLQTIFA
jgi:hypothetical protein